MTYSVANGSAVGCTVAPGLQVPIVTVKNVSAQGSFFCQQRLCKVAAVETMNVGVMFTGYGGSVGGDCGMK